jgi:hypothetical protein
MRSPPAFAPGNLAYGVARGPSFEGLFLEGDGAKGPIGVKVIASWLNHHSFRNANGNQRGTRHSDATHLFGCPLL